MFFKCSRTSLLFPCLGLLAGLSVLVPGPTPAATASSTTAARKTVVTMRTPTPEPTPNPNLVPPEIQRPKTIEANVLPAITPVTLPNIKFPERVGSAPSPDPGLVPKDPSAAALFSAIVPGLGHLYGGESIRGLFFTAAFGISLYLSIDNFKLQQVPNSDERVSHNETAGSIYGLAALAVYGFSIQDAYSSAHRYNRLHHLNVSFSVSPRPAAGLKYSF